MTLPAGDSDAAAAISGIEAHVRSLKTEWPFRSEKMSLLSHTNGKRSNTSPPTGSSSNSKLRIFV